MATLASLVVDLSANTATLAADMQKARRIMESGAAQMNVSLGRLEKGFAMVRGAAVATVAALTTSSVSQFIQRNIEAAGSLGELAEQAGVTVGFLQAMQSAASQTGLSAEETQKGLGKLTAAIGEAARGSDTAVKSFRAAGIGVLEMGGHVRSTEAVLMDLADVIARTEDPQRRAAIANDFLGEKLARKFLPALSGGSAELRKFIENARAAGHVLSDDMVKGADAAADAIAAAELSWAMLERRLVSMLAGPLKQAADNLRKLMGGATFSEQMADAVEQVKRLESLGVPDWSPALAKARKELKALQDQAAAMDSDRARPKPIAPVLIPQSKSEIAAAETAHQTYEKLLRDLALEREALTGSAQATEIATVLKRAHAGATEAQIARLTEEAMATAQLKAEMTAAAAVSAQMLDEAKKQDAARAANAKAMLDQSNASIKMRLDLDDEIAANQALIEALGRSRDAYETLRIEQQILSDARSKGVVMTETEAAEYANTLYAQRKAIDDVTSAQDNLKAAGMDVFHAIGTAAENAVVNFTSLRDVLSGLAQDMLRILYRLAVTKPLETALQGALSGGGGGLLGFLGLGGGGAVTPGATPYAAYTMGPHFAGGTDSAPGGWALVGEQGPELVNLPRGAQVRTNDETMDMLSGGGGRGGAPVIHFNFSTGLSQSIRAELVAMTPFLRALAVDAVTGARARDPRLFRTA